MSDPQSLAPSFSIHVEKMIEAFALRPDEIELLVRGYDIFFKDLFMVCISCGLPCAINALCNYTQGLGNPIVFFNALFGTVGILLSITFFVLWLIEKEKVDKRLKNIKERPAINLTNPQN